MLARRTDLSFENDPARRFLPWLIALMVFLAALALAAAMVFDRMSSRWQQGVSGTLTVQLPAEDDPVVAAQRLDAALASMRAVPGVARADPISETQVVDLLAPWLGTAPAVRELPLPVLIDVELSDPDGSADEVAAMVASAVPAALVDDHRVWLRHLVRLVAAAEAVATVILVVVGGATVGTVVFATRTGLAVHADVIEVLHLVGARDSYIARQFARMALGMGLRGGFLGLALAAPLVFVVGRLAQRLGTAVVPDLSLSPVEWVMLGLVPLVMAAIATVTADITVRRALARMP